METPVLYSFRRCPYAMRARMALQIAEIEVEHREVLLRDKPPQMLAASPKGTVPVLVVRADEVIDESFEIMKWALRRNDPDNWLGDDDRHFISALPLVSRCDGDFKEALDRYKYADRHPEPAQQYRCRATTFLLELGERLAAHRCLVADQITLADIAIMPFVRQFAAVDRPWFDDWAPPQLRRWLDTLIDSTLFGSVMQKHPLWAS